MSAVPWSDAVAEADLHIDADLPTGAMATTSTRVSYSDAARDPAVESSSLPDDDLNVIDERTAALLGRRPPLHRSTFERDNFSFDNTLPDRPRTAYFFLGDTDISTDDIFSEIGTHGILPADVKCLQRNPAGHTYITFTSDHLRNVFLKNSAFVSRRRASNYNLLPGARRVYVAVFDAPYELSNEAIAHRLAPYGEIESHRRASIQNRPDVYNGNRTFYFRRLQKHIPSFMRFGKFLVRIKYPGQHSTCRKCHLYDHQAKDCPNIVCYNCDDIGHTCKNCPHSEKCLICRSTDHRAYHCPFSWRRRLPDFEDDSDADEDLPPPPPPMDLSAAGPDPSRTADPVSPSAVDPAPSSSSSSAPSGSTSTGSSSSSSSAPSQFSSSQPADLPSQDSPATISDSALVAAVSDAELISAAAVPVSGIPVPIVPATGIPVRGVPVRDVPVSSAVVSLPVSAESSPPDDLASQSLFSQEPSSSQAIPPTPVPVDPDPPDTVSADVPMTTNNAGDDDNSTPVSQATVRSDDSFTTTVQSHLAAIATAFRASRIPRTKRLAPINPNSGPPARKSTTPAPPSTRKRSSKSKT